MHKIFKGALLASFIVGVVLYPAWHKAESANRDGPNCACHLPSGETTGPGGADSHDSRPDHDQQKCPACHLAVTPLAVAAAVPAPVAAASLCLSISLPAEFSPVRTFCDSHLARGPPQA